MQSVRAAFALAVAGAMSGAGAATVEAQERHTLQGQDIAIYNLAGSIRVEGGSGSEVTVEVTRRGADASQLRVETGRVRGREALRVIFPGDRIVFQQPNRGGRWYSQSRTTITVADDGTFGDLDRSRGRRVTISSSGSGLAASADLVVRVPPGRTTALHLAAGEVSVTNVQGDLSVDAHAASVTTRGTRGRLELDTGSGDVDVTDAEGELTLDSGSGGVTLTTVRGAAVRLDTGSGSVQARGVTADILRVDTGSGRVSLEEITSPDIVLDTGSGSVDLSLRSDVDNLRIDSGSGRVTVGVPEGLGAMITVETGSGGVDFDIPVTMTRSSRRYFSGQIGDGRGTIEVESGSGSIRFRRP
ncbi:MAG TPA: DUF4097 family beta strand repeat-containing protein [Gemmatimonadaceae bacterium]